MNRGQTGWLFLLLFAIMLIVLGVQGNLGTTVAILFCPAKVDLQE